MENMSDQATGMSEDGGRRTDCGRLQKTDYLKHI